MRKKIRNPFSDEMNRCFACSEANPIGLKLKFEESDEFLHAAWEPSEHYQGYGNVIHGGIIATLLDEIGVWCTYVKAGTACVTSELSIKYIKPVFISRGTITLKAQIVDTTEKYARLHCWLYDSTGVLCAESNASFFLYPEEIARKRLHYPGKEAFYYD